MCPRLERLASALLREHRTGARFHSDRNDGFTLSLFDVARNSGNRAASSHSGHENIDGAVGVFPDFGSGRAIMNLGVGEIGELVMRGPQFMQGYWKAPEATEYMLELLK